MRILRAAILCLICATNAHALSIILYDTDFTTGYTQKASPVGADRVLIYDSVGTDINWATITSISVTDHGALSGLLDDDHTQYALLAGRAGGQTLIGGTAASDDLTLNSTSDASKGRIILGNATTGIIFDEDDEAATIGGGANSHTVNGVTEKSLWEIHTDGNTAPGGTTYHRHSNTAGLSSDLTFMKSAGDHSTPVVVADGEQLGHIRFTGYDGTDYAIAAEIATFVNGTPGNDDMPGMIVFKTSPDGSHTPVELLRLTDVAIVGDTDATTYGVLNVIDDDSSNSDIYYVEGSNTTINRMILNGPTAADAGLVYQAGTVAKWITGYDKLTESYFIQTGSTLGGAGEFQFLNSGNFYMGGNLWLTGNNDRLQFGAISTDLRLYSNGTDGIITVSNGLRIGSATTNYTDIQTDGEIQLVGTARVKREQITRASSITLGVTAPDRETLSVGASGNIEVQTLAFDPTGAAADEEADIEFHIPSDCDDSVNVEYHLMWVPDPNWTTGDFHWCLEYLAQTESSALGSGTPTTICESVTPANATDKIETEFSSTIDANADEILFGRLYLDKSESAADDDGHVLFSELGRTINKFGEAL